MAGATIKRERGLYSAESQARKLNRRIKEVPRFPRCARAQLDFPAQQSRGVAEAWVPFGERDRDRRGSA